LVGEKRERPGDLSKEQLLVARNVWWGKMGGAKVLFNDRGKGEKHERAEGEGGVRSKFKKKTEKQKPPFRKRDRARKEKKRERGGRVRGGRAIGKGRWGKKGGKRGN